MSSIKDVAQLAGVGVSTASRVLRGEGYASAEVRKKVEQAAEELDYVANGPARSMRGGLTKTIGFLVYDILNPFFANLVAGVEEEAFQQGFNAIMCSTQPWKNPEREESYIQMLLQRRIDGLVTQHKFSSSKYIEMLERQGIPIVQLVSSQEGVTSDLVSCDTGQAAQELIRHLIQLGYRRIAALGPRFPSSMGGERLDSYMKALSEAGIEVCDELIALEGWRSRDGYNMVNTLLGRTNPDALFAFGPRIAVGAACALRDKGLRIPEDMALVCIDDFGMGSELDPFMTVARQPEVEMGRKAVQLLVDRIQKTYDGPPRKIDLPAKLIIRRSCGAQLRQSDLFVKNTCHVWEDDEQI